MRRPGLEPGSTAWKAAILTARLSSLIVKARLICYLYDTLKYNLYY